MAAGGDTHARRLLCPIFNIIVKTSVLSITRRTIMLNFGLFFCLFYAVVAALSENYVVPPVNLKPTNYQRWAHLHWVWVKNSDGNQQNVTNLVQGYKDNNIPVGAVNIDSTWATQFNNFEVDKTRFPDFAGLVDALHVQNIRVILWVTSMVNVENPDYDMCVQNKYLLRDSRGYVRPLEWWHGKGGLLDYSNPEALVWWHSKMDQVLDVHVDGFKCDGTDPYVLEYTLTGGALGYNDQIISYREYADMYYRDFFYYTRERNEVEAGGVTVNDAGLIMSRPVDCLLDGFSKGCTPFSPKDVMYSGWVGDDDATFEGLRGCMRKVIYSAWLGYGGFGCDVGGYRGDENSKDKIYFLRSLQLNSFLPLLENGGGGEHRPWMYDQETVDIYRNFVNEHYRLSSYLMQTGAEAVDSGESSIIPVDEKHKDVNSTSAERNVPFPQPKTYSFRLGQDLLVHPVMHDGSESGAAAGDMVNFVDMVFPADGGNSSTLWLDWWRPTDIDKACHSGDRKVRAVPLSSYAVYVRAGSFLPLHDYHLEESKAFEVDIDTPVFTWFQPLLGNVYNADKPLVSSLRESISTGQGMQATVFFDSLDRKSMRGTITAHQGPAAFAFIGITEPNSVEVKSLPLAGCRSRYDGLLRSFKIVCADISGGIKVSVSGYEV